MSAPAANPLAKHERLAESARERLTKAKARGDKADPVELRGAEFAAVEAERELAIARERARTPEINPSAAVELFSDHSPSPPPPPPPTATQAARALVEQAEQRLRDREQAHTAAVARVERAKSERAKFPDADATRDEMRAAKADLELTGDDLEIARSVAEQARDAFEKNAPRFAELDKLIHKQSDHELLAALEPIGVRARALVRELGELCIAAKKAVTRIHEARTQAGDLAKELGLDRTVRLGRYGADEARRVVALAWTKGEFESGLGEPLRWWREAE